MRLSTNSSPTPFSSVGMSIPATLYAGTIADWNVGGVLLRGKMMTDQVGTSMANMPAGVGILPTDSTAQAMIKVVNYANNTFSGNIPAIGPGIGVGDNNRAVFIDVSGLTFIPLTGANVPYTAGVSRTFGTSFTPVYGSGVIDSTSQYLVYTPGDTVKFVIVDDLGTTTISRILTAGGNVGNYGSPARFAIGFDGDPFTMTPALTGQYRAITVGHNASARTILPSNFSSSFSPFSFTAQYTSPGPITTTSKAYAFYVDNPGTPAVTSQSITVVNTAAKTNISGVPSINAGSAVTVGFSVAGIVSEFYNATKIAAISGTAIATVNRAALAGDISTMFPAPTTPYPLTVSGAIAAGVFQANLSITCSTYNAKGTSASAAAVYSTNVLIDTLSQGLGESSVRVDSGVGHYPTSVVGSAYNSAQSLSTSEDLQLLGGKFVYPSIDYTGYTPAGPNYSGISGGSYLGMRWATQNVALGVFVSRGTITIPGWTGGDPTTDILAGNIEIIFRVSSPVASVWHSAITAFTPSAPEADGVGAYESNVGRTFTTSTLTIPLTFGASKNTTTMQVRIGMKNSVVNSFGPFTFAVVAN